MQKPVMSLLAISLLAACAPVFNGETHSLSYTERHPIAVDPDVVTLTFTASPEDVELTSRDIGRINAFANYYLDKGHGAITLTTPTGGRNSVAAMRLASMTREHLHAAGVPWGALKGATYRAPGDSSDAMLTLTFTRFVATASPCGVFTENLAAGPRNLSTPNFGCAAQHNLAAMVSDPRDLVEPRAMTRADATRRGIVLELYREGESTVTEEESQASGVVSDVDGGGS